MVFVSACSASSSEGDDDGGNNPGRADAAIMSQELSCQSYTRIQTATAGSRTESKWSFAAIPVGTFDPAHDRMPQFVACGYHCLGVSCPNACPAGNTCTSTGTDLTGDDCRQMTPYIKDGYLVAYCGYQIAGFDAGGTMLSENGQYYDKVYVVP
jgi:hypothetical protein